MSVPPVLRPKNDKSTVTQREAPLPLMALKSRWARFLPWAAAVLALVIGFTAGAVIMHLRYHAQDTVAAVNGVQIKKDDLFLRLQAAAGQQAMHKLVEEELQLQFAKAQKCPVTPEEIDKKYNEVKDEPQVKSILAASGMSEGEYKRSLSVQLALANVLTAGVTVKDADVQDFYNKQSDPKNLKGQFYTPATVTLRVIATPTAKAALAALADLNTNTPFPLVASEYSIDTSKSSGGLLAPLQQGRSPISQDAKLETAIFNLKVGQLLGPVLFNKGYWIFRCEDKSQAKTKLLTDPKVKEEARLGAAIVEGTKTNGGRIEQKFQSFEANSVLQSFWPRYQRAVTGH